MRYVFSKGYFISSLFLLLSGLWNIAWAKQHEEQTMDSDKSNVLNTVMTMTAAFHKKNITGVLASYEQGGAVMFEPGKPITDPNVLKEMFEGAFQINPLFVYPNGHEVYIANDIAMHIAPWVMTGKAPDGSEISQSGLSVAVLRKQTDGHWLMVLDNPNSSVLMK